MTEERVDSAGVRNVDGVVKAVAKWAGSECDNINSKSKEKERPIKAVDRRLPLPLLRRHIVTECLPACRMEFPTVPAANLRLTV